jgi:hypothetical protein
MSLDAQQKHQFLFTNRDLGHWIEVWKLFSATNKVRVWQA